MTDHDRLLSSPEKFVFWGSPKAKEYELRKAFEQPPDSEEGGEEMNIDPTPPSPSPKQSLYNFLPSVTFSPLSSQLGMFMSNEARIDRAFSPPPSYTNPLHLQTDKYDVLDDLYSAEEAKTGMESSPQRENDNLELESEEIVDSDIEIIVDDASASVQSEMLKVETNIAEETSTKKLPSSPPQIPQLENSIAEEPRQEQKPPSPTTYTIEKSESSNIAVETSKEEHPSISSRDVIEKQQSPRLESKVPEDTKEKQPYSFEDEAKKPEMIKFGNDAADETNKKERPSKTNAVARKPTGMSKKPHKLPVPNIKREDSKIPMPRTIAKPKGSLPSRLLQTLQQPRSIASKSDKKQAVKVSIMSAAKASNTEPLAVKESIIRTTKATDNQLPAVKESITRTIKATDTQPKVMQNTKFKPADHSKPPSKVEAPSVPPPPPTMSDLHFSNQLHVKPIEHTIRPSPLMRENTVIWEGPILPLSPPTTSPTPPTRRNIFSDLPPLSNVPSENVGHRTGNKRTRALLTERKLATPPPPPARNLRKRPSPNIADKENAPSVLRRTDSTKDTCKAEITTKEVPTTTSSTVSTVPKKSSLKRPAPTDEVQEQLTAKELMLTTRRNTARNREYYSAIRKIVVLKDEKRPPSPSTKIKKKIGKGQATRLALGNRKLGTMVPSTEDTQMHDSDASDEEEGVDEPSEGSPRKRVKWSKDVVLSTPEKKARSENILEAPKSLMKRHRLPILDQYGNASNAAASLSPLLGRKQTVTVTKHVYIDDPVGV